ncbi:MerR family DNA-binding transcriptional regulator [Saccharopolyspora sp. NPDC000995]
MDPRSNYRRYPASQLELAVRLKSLRVADIGLAEGERALLGRREAAAVLEEHERGWPRSGSGRTPRSTGWVWCLPVADDDDEGATDHANAVFAPLWQAWAAEDNAPIGPFWSSMRAWPTEDEVEVLCCSPVSWAVPEGWAIPGWTVERGEGRAGLELVVGWRHDEGVPVIDSAVHPAVLVLLAETERRGVDLKIVSMRQIGRLEETGDAIGMEVAIPLRPAGT